MSLPTALTINAWTGEQPASGGISSTAEGWVLGTKPMAVRKTLAPPKEADPRDWRDSRVGWGLILPKRPGLSKAALATADDAPEPIRALLQARGDAPVFRYLPGSRHRFTHLRNYRSGKDLAISGTSAGIGPALLPQYLLIYGTPEEIPWELQYILNATRAVGRLDLQGQALEHYVGKLLKGWDDSQAQVDHAVIWSVDQGDIITPLMRDAIAAKVHADLVGDSDLHGKVEYMDDAAGQSTAATLAQSLAARKPALVVTTSHGQTGPLNDAELMRAKLGLPVGHDSQTVDPEQLLATWAPDGAIWYAHACCSAGCDSVTLFDGLVEAGSNIDRVLKGVAKLGAQTAPLPRALLGASKPLRAFIGHVEPTFDWTLSNPATGQHLTDNLRRALYNNLYSGQPVGLAFQECYKPLGSLYTQYEKAFRAFNNGAGLLKSRAIGGFCHAEPQRSVSRFVRPRCLAPARHDRSSTFEKP